MSSTLHYLRRSLMVVATLFTASLAAGEASACSAMRPGQGGCVTVCSCCATDLAASLEQDQAWPVAVPQRPVRCESSSVPGGACTCRSQDPMAPTSVPKPARSTAEGRGGAELGLNTAFLPPGDDLARRNTCLSRGPATQSPPKVPLYLRNERFLF